MDKEDTKYVADILGAKDEKQITRLWIALGIMVLLFVATNTFWIYREFQYEDVVAETYTTTSDGNSVFVNGTGELILNDKDYLQESESAGEKERK